MNSVIDQLMADGIAVNDSAGPLTPTELAAMAEDLGTPLETERHTVEHPAVQRIAPDALFGNDEVPWHNDWSYGQGDFHGTLLYNHAGGVQAETWFVDMAEACAALPTSETARLRKLRGEYYPPGYLHECCFTPRQLRYLRRMKVARPLVFDHPVSRQSVLYISPGTLTRVVDDEGKDLTEAVDIDGLVRHCEQFQWPHRWALEQVLVYDNLRVMHRRAHFIGQRELWRVQIRLDCHSRMAALGVQVDSLDGARAGRADNVMEKTA